MGEEKAGWKEVVGGLDEGKDLAPQLSGQAGYKGSTVDLTFEVDVVDGHGGQEQELHFRQESGARAIVLGA